LREFGSSNRFRLILETWYRMSNALSYSGTSPSSRVW